MIEDEQLIKFLQNDADKYRNRYHQAMLLLEAAVWDIDKILEVRRCKFCLLLHSAVEYHEANGDPTKLHRPECVVRKLMLEGG